MTPRYCIQFSPFSSDRKDMDKLKGTQQKPSEVVGDEALAL